MVRLPAPPLYVAADSFGIRGACSVPRNRGIQRLNMPVRRPPSPGEGSSGRHSRAQLDDVVRAAPLDDRLRELATQRLQGNVVYTSMDEPVFRGL
jgi:hypothetical protein